MGSNTSRVPKSPSDSLRGRTIDGPPARENANQNETQVRGAHSVDGIGGGTERLPVQGDTGQFVSTQFPAVRGEVARVKLKKPTGSQVVNMTQRKIDKCSEKSAAMLEHEVTSPIETQSKNQDGVQMREGQIDAAQSVNKGTKISTNEVEFQVNHLETDIVNINGIERGCEVVDSQQSGNEVKKSRQGYNSGINKNCARAASEVKKSSEGYQTGRQCSKRQTLCAKKYMNAINPKANSKIDASANSFVTDVHINNTRDAASKTYVYNNEGSKGFRPSKESALVFEANNQGKTLMALSTEKEANHVLLPDAAEGFQQALSLRLNQLVGQSGEVLVTAEVTKPGLASTMSPEEISDYSPEIIVQLMTPEQTSFCLGPFLECYLDRAVERKYILSGIDINQPMLDRLTKPEMASTLFFEQISSYSMEDILKLIQPILPQQISLPLGDHFPKCSLDRGEDGNYILSVEDATHPLIGRLKASNQNQKSPGAQASLVDSLIASAQNAESPHS